MSPASFCRLGAHDHAGAVGELGDQRRERVLELQSHGRGVGHLDLVHGGQLGLAERALHGHVPLEARLDRLRVHGLAVVELDALAQLDGDRLAVLGGLVRQRQLRHDVELVVDVEQLVAQRGEHDAADVGARQRRIEHVGVLGQADAQRRLRQGRRRTGQQNSRRRNRKTEPVHEIALPSWCAMARFSLHPWHRMPETDAAGSAENSGPAAQAGGREETMSRHRWQAVACPSPAATSSGRERLQTSWAWAQRGCRWQPGGGLSGLGGSPGRMRRCRRSPVDSTGTADSSACV